MKLPKCPKRPRIRVNGAFWLFEIKLMIIWASLSSAFLLYPITNQLYAIWKYGFFSEIVSRTLGPFVSICGSVFSFSYLCFKRKKLATLYREVLQLARATDKNIVQSHVFKVTVLLLVCIVYSVCLMSHSLVLSNNDVLEQNLFNFTCFGCDYLSYGNSKFFLTLLLVLNAPVTIGASVLKVLFYCFVTSMVADVLNISVKQVALKNSHSDSLLRSLRHRLLLVREVVSRVNEDFGVAVFIWFGSSLITFCHNVTWILKPAVFSSSLDFIIYISLYLKDFVLVILVVVNASKLPAVYDLSLNSLSDLSNEDNFKVMVLTYSEFKPEKFVFKVGSCFSITKNLLLSFFGLGITYTLIYIQFNPDVVLVLQGKTTA